MEDAHSPPRLRVIGTLSNRFPTFLHDDDHDDVADHDDDELTLRDRNPIKQVPNIAFFCILATFF